MNKINIVLALFSSFFLFSCSSLEKKAQEYLENGSYQEAINTYSQTLKENPGNQDAHAGLKKSKNESIFRCLKVTKSNPPDFIQKWFESNLGLSVADTNAVFKNTL